MSMNINLACFMSFVCFGAEWVDISKDYLLVAGVEIALPSSIYLSLI
jgi:hypothetical protein